MAENREDPREGTSREDQTEQLRRQLERIKSYLEKLVQIAEADRTGLLASSLIPGAGSSGSPVALASGFIGAIQQTAAEIASAPSMLMGGMVSQMAALTPLGSGLRQARIASILPEVQEAALAELPRFQTGRRYGAGAFTISSQMRKWRALGIPVPGLAMLEASENIARGFFRGIRQGIPAGASVIPGGMAMASMVTGRPAGYNFETIMAARAAGADISPILDMARSFSMGLPMPAFAGAFAGWPGSPAVPSGAGDPFRVTVSGGSGVESQVRAGGTRFLGGMGKLPVF